MIAEGENEEVEFKQTLRWDIKQCNVNKELEGVIMKTIAAFANALGGTLLIGVADNGGISGLDNDYKALTGGNRDKFELHLKTLIINTFGEAFAATKVKLSLPQIDEKEICRVEILPADKPIDIKLADKGGAAQDRLYVRNGNSTREMTGDQAITSRSVSSDANRRRSPMEDGTYQQTSASPSGFSEGLVEEVVLSTFKELGYTCQRSGVISPDGSAPARLAYGDVLLTEMLAAAIERLNH